MASLVSLILLWASFIHGDVPAVLWGRTATHKQCQGLDPSSPPAAPMWAGHPHTPPASESSGQSASGETSPSSGRPPGSHLPAQPCFPGVGLLVRVFRGPLPRSRILLPHRETPRQTWCFPSAAMALEPSLSPTCRCWLSGVHGGTWPPCPGAKTLLHGLWQGPPQRTCLPAGP